MLAAPCGAAPCGAGACGAGKCGAGKCGAGAPARVPASPALPAPLAGVGTTRGPVNNAASPRPSARRFSTIFSLSFSPVAVLFILTVPLMSSTLNFRTCVFRPRAFARRVVFFTVIRSVAKDPYQPSPEHT